MKMRGIYLYITNGLLLLLLFFFLGGGGIHSIKTVFYKQNILSAT